MRTPTYTFATPTRQRGVVATFIALIVLVATLIAAAALTVSVNTSSIIAGNMSFRQGLIQESERAYAALHADAAFDTPAAEQDIPGAGYFASIQIASATHPGLPDALTRKPFSAEVKALPPTVTGNAVHYVIERLCTLPGPATRANCIAPQASISGGSVSNQTGDQGNAAFLRSLPVAYRLSVRVDGPRNGVAYMQTILR